MGIRKGESLDMECGPSRVQVSHRRLFGFSLLVMTLLPWLASARGEALVGKPAPEFSLRDYQGKTHRLSDYRGRWVVLEWINVECPFVGKHYRSGNLPRLQKKYRAKGVVWLAICSSAPGKPGYMTPVQAETVLRRMGFGGDAYLLDPDGTTGRAYGARTTPHLFLINPEGKLLYAGAIDDIASVDVGDIARAHNYIEEALEAALAGRPVPHPTSVPYGCSVKYAELP
ncbi:thioredoxin family protein [Candidatus Methylacidithermus pantelleriae]|uniref:PPO candidate 1 n=1 Tax=Candidatus Methylacidithermus pantelleriae TaxID=2744239 RepID=A0A8J2BLG2_9BACT|nr:thioredoxin family protein [Candidatus Methylacidithermus pantelleriae]CAF0693041.1 PPO candidate 1 [Candidatus Methylacidithermus pantelleriae]